MLSPAQNHGEKKKQMLEDVGPKLGHPTNHSYKCKEREYELGYSVLCECDGDRE